MNKKWYKKYINYRFIDISKYLSLTDKKNLEKLDILIEERLYTEREFELFNIKLFRMYENSSQKQQVVLKKYNINITDFINLLNIFNIIEKDYDLWALYIF